MIFFVFKSLSKSLEMKNRNLQTLWILFFQKYVSEMPSSCRLVLFININSPHEGRVAKPHSLYWSVTFLKFCRLAKEGAAPHLIQ